MRAMRRWFFPLVVLCFGAPVVAQDLVAIAPQYAKVVHEDARVRVVHLQVPPHTSVPMHDRGPRIVIPLANSVVTTTTPEGRSGPARSVAGTAGWSGVTKRSYVTGDEPVDNVIVEFKRAAQPAQPLGSLPTDGPGFIGAHFHRWLFGNQYTNAYDVRIPAAVTTHWVTHSWDEVRVYLSAGSVSTLPRGGSASPPEKRNAGTVSWSACVKQPCERREKNAGTAEFHYILIQVLPYEPFPPATRAARGR